MYVGIDVSKEKFDACGIGDEGKKIFSLSFPMNRDGFDKLVTRLAAVNTASLLVGMESTASYPVPLFSYLTAKGYRVAIINPLLIANFAKLSLRKTKTDKRDAKILTSMRGIGDKTAFNFLIEMGGAIKAFEHDRKLIAAAGLDPTTYESGKYKGQSKISKRGNRHLRRVIWLMTTKVIIANPIFRSYYFKRRKEGLIYKKAVLATAHKLVRVMFSMLVNQTLFEAERRK